MTNPPNTPPADTMLARKRAEKLVDLSDKLFKENKFAEAVTQSQAAIDADPTYEWAYVGIAKAYRELGEFGKIITILGQGLTIIDNHRLHDYLGDAHNSLEQWEAALSHYYRVLELDPKAYYTASSIGFCFQKGFNDLEKATEWFQKSLAIEPNNGYALGRLGMIAESRGDLTTALRYYERTASTSSGNLWSADLARVRNKINQRDQWDSLPTIDEMVAYLNRFVCGQERAKLDITAAVYNHYISVAHQEANPLNSDLGRYNVLVFGPSGCGKTYMIELLTKKLGVPLVIVSATSLVQVGYVGKKVDSIMEDLLAAAEYKVDRAERGIVFIDEIDKVRKSNTKDGPDVSGEGVQNALLTMLEGKEFRIEPEDKGSFMVNSSKILFIGAGAFDGITEIVGKRLNRSRRSLGFGEGAVLKGEGPADSELLDSTTVEDLENFGLIPQLAGRFSAISNLRVLTRDDLRNILTSMENSILQKQKKLFELHGIVLEFSAEALEAVLDGVNSARTGARGLRSALSQALRPITARINQLAAQGVTGITITKDCVQKGAEPELGKESNNIAAVAEQYRRGAFERMLNKHT